MNVKAVKGSRFWSIVALFTVLFTVAIWSFQHWRRPNLNTADANTIAKLVYDVGPERARSIVAERSAHGPFEDWLDFAERMKSHDIGPVTVARCKEVLRIGR